jgi:flavin-dependent dehydrogenase
VRSRVARELGVRRDVPWLSKLALTTRYGGVAWGDRAEVHFLDGAFFACAPVHGAPGLGAPRLGENGGEQVSLNLVLETERFRRAGLPRERALEHWLEQVPALRERLERGRRVEPVRGLGPLAARTSAQAFDGAALVGDACGYVDPVTGEGIFFALKGAELLAADLAGALRARRTDRDALARYLAGRRAEIESRERIGLWLQRALRRPRLTRAAFALLAARPRLADVLVSLAGDYVPPSELLRPRAWFSLSSTGGRS